MPGRITVAAAAAVAVAVVVFGAALAFGRADVAVIGMVLLVAVGVAIGRPRSRDVRIELDEEEGTGSGETVVRLRVSAPDDETVRLTSTALGFDTSTIAVAPPTSLAFRLPLTHTGRQELLAVTAQGVGPDGTRVADPVTAPPLRVRVPPRTIRLPAVPLPFVLGGRTGSHDSRRPGQGGEFHDIHPFAPGDRLRRIDWRATARLARAPGDLFVRRSLATADADVALVLDDRDDLSGAPGSWNTGDRSSSAPTSLDVAREAAWSLASAYLDAADQVSFRLVSHSGADVVRGSGSRQRHALRTAITSVESGSSFARVGAPWIPGGSLVVLLSTFLDDHTVDLAVRWRRSGRRVLAIDTLPRLRTERVRRETAIAQRMVLGARAARLTTLRAVGADLVRWDAPEGERAAAFRALARRRRRA